MDTVSFHLPVFDGPLDLLLYLISKNKINIYDIPIAEIFEQYMDYINEAEAHDIELISDFAAMAAQLLYIKSKMLLPTHSDEPEEDPRARLVETLLEYQRIKSLTEYFGKRAEIGRDTFVKQAEPLDPSKTYEYHHTADQLISALLSAAERSGRRMPPPVSAFSGIVGHEKALVSEQIARITTLVSERKTVAFRDILTPARNRSELVAIFLALLELLRDGLIRADDNGDDYMITERIPDKADVRTSSDEEAFY